LVGCTSQQPGGFLPLRVFKPSSSESADRGRSIILVSKHRSMERSGVKCFHYTHVFDLTNLKGEKRRNVGKLNNELNIVNQLVDLHFLLFVNITGN
jgi:hypothetical protein